MSKKILPSLCVIFMFPAGNNASAQTHPFQIEVAAGVGLPVGQYADKTFDLTPSNLKPGELATAGFTGNLSLLYELKKHFGVLITGGMNFNKQDAESYRKWAVGSSPNTTAYPDVNSWKVLNLMGGGFYTFPAGKKSKGYFRAEVAVGAAKTAVPGFSITSQSGSQLSYVVYAKQPLPWGICFRGKMEFYYQLFKSFYWHVETSYFDGRLKYHYYYYPNFPNTYVRVSATRRYNITTVNFCGGVGVRF